MPRERPARRREAGVSVIAEGLLQDFEDRRRIVFTGGPENDSLGAEPGAPDTDHA